MIRHLDRENRPLFIVLFLNFILFGGIVTIIGATLPEIIRAFAWSYLVTGVVIAAGSVGYFVSAFLCGILAQRIGAKKVMMLGLFLQAIGLGCFGLLSHMLFNLTVLLLIGFGQGATEVITNYCVVQLERDGQSRLMNLMHSAFTVGAVVGPFGTGILMKMAFGWQIMYRCMAVLSLVVIFALMRFAFTSIGEDKRGHASHTAVAELLRNPLLILLVLTIFLYVGVETGVSAWISEYYVKIFGHAASTGAYMVSIYWSGILLGRLLVSMLYRGDRQAHLLLGFACIAGISLTLALLVKIAGLAGVFFMLTGVGYSAIYPVVMALVGQHFKRGQSIAIGIVSTGGGIGSFFFPLMMSSIANAYTLTHGFWLYLCITLVMVVTSTGVLWRTRLVVAR